MHRKRYQVQCFEINREPTTVQPHSPSKFCDFQIETVSSEYCKKIKDVHAESMPLKFREYQSRITPELIKGQGAHTAFLGKRTYHFLKRALFQSTNL